MNTVKASLCAVFGLGLALLNPAEVLAQRAQVTRINTQMDVYRGGQRGMLITLDMEVDGLRGRQVNVAAFFSFQDGRKLIARPGSLRYATPDGQVTTQRKEVPLYDFTNFTNVELFIPYDELYLAGTGRFDLKYQVEVQYNDGGRWPALAITPDQFFTINVN
jgi:hypothetical protein